MTSITDNIATIKQSITEYEKKYGRAPGSVQLLAASKGQPLQKLQEAIHAGQRIFGESYVQEALPKIEALKDLPLEWHFIGPLQKNKTRKVAEHFAWVHSIDDIKIAKRLNEQRPDHLPPLNICIEVNVSHEKTKSGVTLNEVEALAHECLTLPRLALRGLMTIPAPSHDIVQQRHAYQKLSHLLSSLRTKGIPLDTLSIGMSNDFEAAIAEGGTLVRIGVAIFGPRRKP